MKRESEGEDSIGEYDEIRRSNLPHYSPRVHQYTENYPTNQQVYSPKSHSAHSLPTTASKHIGGDLFTSPLLGSHGKENIEIALEQAEIPGGLEGGSRRSSLANRLDNKFQILTQFSKELDDDECDLLLFKNKLFRIISDLQNDLREASNCIGIQTEDRKKLKGIIANLRKVLGEMENKEKHNDNEIQRQNLELAEKEGDIQDLISKVENKERENENIAGLFNEQKNDNEKLIADNINLEKTLDDYNKQNEQLKAIVGDLREEMHEKNQQWAGENKSLKNFLTESDAKNTKLGQEIEGLGEEINIRNNKIDDLIKHYDEEGDALREENQALREVNNRLKNLIEEREEELQREELEKHRRKEEKLGKLLDRKKLRLEEIMKRKEDVQKQPLGEKLPQILKDINTISKSPKMREKAPMESYRGGMHERNTPPVNSLKESAPTLPKSAKMGSPREYIVEGSPNKYKRADRKGYKEGNKQSGIPMRGTSEEGVDNIVDNRDKRGEPKSKKGHKKTSSMVERVGDSLSPLEYRSPSARNNEDRRELKEEPGVENNNINNIPEKYSGRRPGRGEKGQLDLDRAERNLKSGDPEAVREAADVILERVREDREMNAMLEKAFPQLPGLIEDEGYFDFILRMLQFFLDLLRYQKSRSLSPCLSSPRGLGVGLGMSPGVGGRSGSQGSQGGSLGHPGGHLGHSASPYSRNLESRREQLQKEYQQKYKGNVGVKGEGEDFLQSPQFINFVSAELTECLNIELLPSTSLLPPSTTKAGVLLLPIHHFEGLKNDVLTDIWALIAPMRPQATKTDIIGLTRHYFREELDINGVYHRLGLRGYKGYAQKLQNELFQAVNDELTAPYYQNKY